MRTFIVVAVAVGLILALLSIVRNGMQITSEKLEGILTVETVVLPPSGEEVAVEITLKNVGAIRTITEITLPTKLVDALESWAPEGFRREPFAGKETPPRERERLNAEQTRWVGAFEVKPGLATVFRIPARTPQRGSGTIHFRMLAHEGRITNSFDVQLSATPEAAAP